MFLRLFPLYALQLYANLGLMLGLCFGALLLLRPVINRILRPKYRVALWMAVWVMGYNASFVEILGFVAVLPVTFRGWITPRLADGHLYPSYLPEMTRAGEYTVALPGGGVIPFNVSEGMLNLLAVAVVIGVVAIFWWAFREENRIKRLARDGEPMGEEWNKDHGIYEPGIQVRIMPDLPASFVCRTGIGVHSICLQKELPKQQMELVLRHELAHIHHRHPWAKGILMAMLAFYWWNPIMWAAYRIVCRDIELACDEAVLEDLNDDQRREYARTLVELGSGRPMWGGLTCFGECDAELRVRRTVAWKPEMRWGWAIAVPLLVLSFLFLFTNPTGTPQRHAEAFAEYMAGEFEEDFYARQAVNGKITEVRANYRGNECDLLVFTSDGERHLFGVRWWPQTQKYDWHSWRFAQDGNEYPNYVPLTGWEGGNS